MVRVSKFWLAVVLCCLSLTNWASAQIIIVPHPPHRLPRPRPIPSPQPTYRVQSVDMQATVRDQLAQVQVSQVFQNTSSQTIEASFFFPLPDSASVSGLTLLVDGKELPGKLLKKEEAKRIYEETVRRNRDPALLEYMGQGLYQTSVFPIPAQATRTVQIRYSQLLKQDSGLIDLSLPLGTNKFSNKPVDSLKVNLRIETTSPIKSLHSPTHGLTIKREDDTHAVCSLDLQNVVTTEDLRLLFGTQTGPIGMHVLSYRPQAGEDGYFLMLASPEVKAAQQQVIDKTVVVVVDKSGSMSGDKITQAREALKFVLRQLRPGDLFNIVAYDSAVETFRPELQKADEATINAAVGYAEGLFAGGSTNIDGALQTTLKMLTDSSRPNYVLFMTDGLPTVGEQNEIKIAQNAKQSNQVQARMFNFGVGYDVNSKLLDRLSREQRGLSLYVKPKENIEAPVAALTQKITSPLLTSLALDWSFDTPVTAGQAAPVSRVYPRQMPDLFVGDQLVLVGRYRLNGAAKVKLTGRVGSETREFTFPAELVAQSMGESNGFIEKLWASRRIGEIIDDLDLNGQNQELVDELVQLSIKHGIMTPYTSFLADERTDLAAARSNRRLATESLSENLSVVSGASGFNQRAGKQRLFDGTTDRLAVSGPETAKSEPAPAAQPAAKRLRYLSLEGESKELDSVLSLGQKTFYRRNKQWRDGSVTPEQEKQAKRVKQFSPEYFELANKNGPELAKYLAFTEPVLINLNDEIYLIEPDAEPATE